MDLAVLGNTVPAVVEQYAKMSNRLPVPESFIRDACAISINKDKGVKVSVELPIRTFVNEWRMDQLEFSGLGSFRVDLAMYAQAAGPNGIDLEALVEFKLWTDRFKVARDVRKLKQICRAVDAFEELNNEQQTNGYVVVCPQYYQGLSAIQGAFEDFAQRFPIGWHSIRECKLEGGHTFGIGAAVIDVNECNEGNFG